MTYKHRKINWLFLHTAADGRDTEKLGDGDTTPEEIIAWHTSPPPNGLGWSRAGYHFLIRKEGDVHKMVPTDIVSNGVWRANADSIHICLSGNGDVEAPTRKQLVSLARLVRDLRAEHGSDLQLIGHRDAHYYIPKLRVIKKTCPGKKVNMNLVRQFVDAWTEQ